MFTSCLRLVYVYLPLGGKRAPIWGKRRPSPCTATATHLPPAHGRSICQSPRPPPDACREPAWPLPNQKVGSLHRSQPRSRQPGGPRAWRVTFAADKIANQRGGSCLCPLAVARTRPLFSLSVTPCPLLPSLWTITIPSKLGNRRPT